MTKLKKKVDIRITTATQDDKYATHPLHNSNAGGSHRLLASNRHTVDSHVKHAQNILASQ